MAIGVTASPVKLSSIAWPDVASIRDTLRFAYDGPTDTLFVNFFGEARPAASIASDHDDADYIMVRVDMRSAEAVGFQIEDFLSYAVPRHPWLLEALRYADFREVDDRRAAELRTRVIEIGQEASDATSLVSAMERLVA